MADNSVDELGRNIAKELTPLGRSNMGKFDPAPMLEMLKKWMLQDQKRGRTPRLDEPLPRFDPRTGGIIEPPSGPMGPRGSQK